MTGLHAAWLAALAAVAALAPNLALAYVGPGAGLTAIGTIVALLGALGLALVGFVWYPVKRLMRRGVLDARAPQLTVLALSAGVLAFVGLLRLLGAAEAGGAVVRTARGAVAALASPELGDDAKEAAARQAAARLLRGFAALAGIGLAALAASGAIVWVGSAAGLYPLGAAIETASGLPFLAGLSLLAVAVWVALERWR